MASTAKRSVFLPGMVFFLLFSAASRAAGPETSVSRPADSPTNPPGKLDVESLNFEPNIRWMYFSRDDQPEISQMQVRLLIYGPAAEGASGYGNLKIDSIRDDSGKPVSSTLPGPVPSAQEPMRRIDRRFGLHPQDGLEIYLGSYDPPAAKKLSELRGCIDLRTGGRYETLVLPNVLKRPDRPVENDLLKKLGLTVKVKCIHPAPRKDDAPRDSGKRSDAAVLWTVPTDIETMERCRIEIQEDQNPVVRYALTDARGKTLRESCTNLHGSEKKYRVDLCYEKPLPDNVRLKLTVHADPQILHVPFALKNVMIPPQKKAVAGSSSPAVSIGTLPDSKTTSPSAPPPSIDLGQAIVRNIFSLDGKSSAPSAATPAEPPQEPEEIRVDVKSGSCTLTDGSESEGRYEVRVGTKLKGTCRFSLSDFFGQQIISAPIEVSNQSEKPMHCHYYVAFFDKNGNLLGCTGQGTMKDGGIAPGDNTQFGSCLIPLPKTVREKAVSYKITYYESDMPIGTKSDKPVPMEKPRQ